MLLTCQAIFGEQRGEELSSFFEQSSGEPCPCRQGSPCPLMPADEVRVPQPRLRGQVGELRVAAATVLAGYGLVAMKVGSAVL